MADQKTHDVVIVGGLGHIGLPLGIVFADKGLKTIAYDINEENAEIVKSGQLPFIEYGMEDLLPKVLKSGKLEVSLDIEDVRKAKYVIITIGTPVDEYLNPKLKNFMQFFDNLKNYLDPSQTIIVRSSVFPHTCDMMMRSLGGDTNKWKLSYCPERIVQGYALKELPELPQIVSGVSQEAIDSASELFLHVSPEVVETSIEEAEVIKLMANSWRYIQFAAANQFYMICEQNGLDYDKIRQAMRQGYPRAQTVAGAGFAAGPCLLKDTMQLSSFSGNNFSLGTASMNINEGLPNFLVQRLRRERQLEDTTVGILGMAFKANIDDPRDALSYKLWKVLHFYGTTVLPSDVYIQDDRFFTPEEVIAKSDVVIVGVPHKEYKALTFPEDTELIDLWNFIPCEG